MSPDRADQTTAPYELNTPYAPTPDNRPEVLAYSPLALTREGHSQMSFGERAALEGLLAQVHPQLAIEIGTAEGGSLARIAAYSKEVHSIDLVHDQLAVELGEHVNFHTGPSTEMLPKLLEQLADSGRAVDFALVDGDHSYAGVVHDIRTLLESPTTARCVIVVHDSMNEEVRAGIESIDLDAYEKVVYHELDFVPGYMYREGSALNSIWGGIALLLCDTQRSVAYSTSTRQWRYREPYTAIHRMRAELLGLDGHDSPPSSDDQPGRRDDELDRLSTRLAAAETELRHQAQDLAVVYGSRSWRLTAPMRTAALAIRARRAARR